jgi:tripartite-type tricarboxylate transporter receptor subunit TctC
LARCDRTERAPQPILIKLNDAINTIVGMEDLRSRLKDLGMNPVGRGSPAELQLFLESEIARWGKVVDAAGIAGTE